MESSVLISSSLRRDVQNGCGFSKKKCHTSCYPVPSSFVLCFHTYKEVYLEGITSSLFLVLRAYLL